MKTLQKLLLIFGALFAVGFVTGIQSWHWSSRDDSLVTYYQGWRRCLPFFGSLFCFTWLFGIIKRHIWGWYVGCAVFVLSILLVLIFQALIPFLSAPVKGDGWWALVSQTILAALIFLVFKKWWIPKKHEFQ
jgi:hypothetical protein